MQGFELENWAHNFKIENSPKKNLLCYTVTQLFKDGTHKEKKNPKRTTYMSVKISKINIYENNWQTTVYDLGTKNIVADVLSKGYSLWEATYSRPYVFSALRKEILSHFNSGEHRVPVHMQRKSFSVRQLWAKISGFICKEVTYTVEWNTNRK